MYVDYTASNPQALSQWSGAPYPTALDMQLQQSAIDYRHYTAGMVMPHPRYSDPNDRFLTGSRLGNMAAGFALGFVNGALPMLAVFVPGVSPAASAAAVCVGGATSGVAVAFAAAMPGPRYSDTRCVCPIAFGIYSIAASATAAGIFMQKQVDPSQLSIFDLPVPDPPPSAGTLAGIGIGVFLGFGLLQYVVLKGFYALNRAPVVPWSARLRARQTPQVELTSPA